MSSGGRIRIKDLRHQTTVDVIRNCGISFTPTRDVVAACTDGNDVINGSDSSDNIECLGGNDTIHGRDGNDELRGNDGNDEIHGGGGNDRVVGGSGDDRIYGDGGNDELVGGPGYDHAYGGNGDDTFIYRRGDGVLIIHADGNGHDRLVCRDGARIRNRRWDGDDRILEMNGSGEIKIKNHRNGNNIESIEGCD
jgi:Ca2+-binding RTX toxin-like protein